MMNSDFHLQSLTEDNEYLKPERVLDLRARLEAEHERIVALMRKGCSHGEFSVLQLTQEAVSTAMLVVDVARTKAGI